MAQGRDFWIVLAILLVLVVLVTVYVALVVLPWSRKRRQQLTDCIHDCVGSRGWQISAGVFFDDSFIPTGLRGPYVQREARGTYKGLFAGFAITHVYKWRPATLVLVRCPRPLQSPQDFVGAVDAADQYAYGNDPGPAVLANRFRFTGRAERLAALFAPPEQDAILRFPRRINQIMFDGNAVSLVWLDWETDATIVDQALEIAWTMAHRVEMMSMSALGPRV